MAGNGRLRREGAPPSPGYRGLGPALKTEPRPRPRGRRRPSVRPSASQAPSFVRGCLLMDAGFPPVMGAIFVLLSLAGDGQAARDREVMLGQPPRRLHQLVAVVRRVE